MKRPVAHEAVTELQRFSFDKGQNSLKAWEEKVFKGHTTFNVVQENGLFYLSSQSQNACSGLYVKMKQEVTPDLWLSWKWRVHEFPQKKHPELLSSRSEDDFGARIYIIFLAPNLFRSDVIEYIWDEQFPIGSVSDSPYSERIKLVVIRNGLSKIKNDAGWASEERNIYEDYKKLFGKEPTKPLGFVALMSDSDSTESKAAADFTNIILKKKSL